MNYNTLATQYADFSAHIDRHIRRIVDVATRRRGYGRITEWENKRQVLRSQVLPTIVLILYWLTLSWVAGWDLGDTTTTYVPAQTQSETQAQPTTFGCR